MKSEIVKALTDHIGLFTAGLGLLSLLIPKWREKVGAFFIWLPRKFLWALMAEIYRKIDETHRLVADGAPRWDQAAKDAEELKEEVRALTRIVKNGLSHSVAKLLARDRADFEAKHVPAFVCDETGANWLVSEGYTTLIGMDRASLKGHGWENCITGPLKTEYIDRFVRCVQNKEEFVSVVDFQNPATGEHRGRWRVHAPCEAVNDALVFTGAFIRAEDDTAYALAEEHGWLIPQADSQLRLNSSQSPE